jgi:tetratricopeptide (TPR) repeat protein
MSAGLDQAAQVRALAQTYHDAALLPADMTAVTQVLESLRTNWTLCDANVDAWRETDDAISRSDDPVLTGLLLDLRQRVMAAVTGATLAELEQAFGVGLATGRAALRTACAASIAKGRPGVCAILAAADLPGLAADDGDRQLLRKLAQIAQREAWPLATPLLQDLADDPCVGARERCLLLAMLGQIAFYYDKAPDLARRRHDQALALDPGSCFGWTCLGQFWVEQGDAAEARRCFDRAIAADRRDGQVCACLGDGLDKENKPALAQEWYEEGLRRQPSHAGCASRMIRLWGRSALQGEHPDLPDRLTERMMLADPDAAHWLLREAGYACLQRDELERALAWFDRAVALDPAHPDGHIGRGHVLETLGRLDDALAAAEQAIVVLPEMPDGHALVARMAEDRQRWLRAEAANRDAAARNPSARTYHLAKAAHMAWQDGRRDEARAELLQLLHVAPQDDGVLGVLERVSDDLQRNAGDRPGALALLAEVRAAAGASYEARWRNRQGDLAEAAGDLDEAAAQYQAAIADQPGRALYYINLSRVWRAQRIWDGADPLWERAPPEVRADTTLRDRVGTLFNEHAVELHIAEQYGQALPLYRRALEVNPEDAVVYSNLALACEAAGDEVAPLGARIAEGLAALQRAVALRPENASYRTRLAAMQAREQLLRVYGSAAATADWTATPLVVELSESLVPLVQQDSGGLTARMLALLAEMHARVRTRYGVQAPGVRLRANAVWAGARYGIRLSEELVAVAELDLDQRFCPAPADALVAAGIVPQPATLPDGGAQGHWIAQPDWPAAEAAGLLLWQPMELALRHLERLLPRELPDFISVQEADTLLRQAEAALADRVLAAGLPRFVAALRGLLSDGASVADIAALATRWLALRAAGTPEPALHEALRADPSVQTSLPGPAANRRVGLGPRLSSLLASSVRDDGCVSALVIVPDACQQALAAVREQIGDSVSETVLVVDSATLRPLVRALVAIEWPALPVCLRSELASPGRTDAWAELE